MPDEHIDEIMKAFDSKKDIKYFSKSVDSKIIADNKYNLSVSTYVEKKDTREKVDILKLNAEIAEMVKREHGLRNEIDKIIAEIEAK